MARPFIYSTLIKQQQHMAYLKMRAQAKLRNEKFLITIEEFMRVWPDDLWLKRGRGSDQYSMTRINPNKPWQVNNVAIMCRADQLRYAIEKTMERRQNASISTV